MPLYQYTCGQCGLKVEILREVAERDLEAECACGGMRVRDLFPGGHVSRLFEERASNVSEPTSGATGISIEGAGGVTIVDCSFAGLERGIVAAPEAPLSLTRTKFKDVKIPIERKRK